VIRAFISSWFYHVVQVFIIILNDLELFGHFNLDDLWGVSFKTSLHCYLFLEGRNHSFSFAIPRTLGSLLIEEQVFYRNEGH
jgi:hypothetical protein